MVRRKRVPYGQKALAEGIIRLFLRLFRPQPNIRVCRFPQVDTGCEDPVSPVGIALLEQDASCSWVFCIF
jgi:hypothetical protein